MPVSIPTEWFSLPNATAVLSEEPPGQGLKKICESAFWSGMKSIRASPQQRIIGPHLRLVGEIIPGMNSPLSAY